MLALLVVAVRAADDTKPQKPDEIWKELLQKYRTAKTPAERNDLLETYTKKLLEHAGKNAKQESALESLNYILQIPLPIKGDPQTKAAAVLKKDFINNKDATKAIRARAANLYLGTQEKVVMADKDAKTVAAAKKEMEDVRKIARDELKGLVKDLFLGAAMPELKSKNLEDKDVKLSDLKGKVVVLDIWATWCPPCRAMIPHEREMVKKFKGKPFVLVSISADAKKETVTGFLEKNEMPWTHWWNGAKGGILSELNVRYYPTIYILDTKGVIRFKDVRDKAMEKAVETLLKEVEDKTKGT